MSMQQCFLLFALSAIIVMSAVLVQNVHGTFDDVYNDCYIRTGCSQVLLRVPYFSFFYGAWFCSDHPTSPVTRPFPPWLRPLDDCQIRVDCDTNPQFNEDIQTWTCDGEYPGALYDQCYIHAGCGTDVGVSFDTTNRAWFCNDQSQLVVGVTEFDNCFIHKECGPPEDGLFPIYNILLETWYCSDAILYDACAIHPGCDAGIYFDFNDNIWYCADDVRLAPGEVGDNCNIQQGCPNDFLDSSNFNVDNFNEAWTCDVPPSPPQFDVAP